MSPSELAFLSGGLALGVLAGGALIEVIRARPAARREVRVTVSAGPSGGRAATLATSLRSYEMARAQDDAVAPGPPTERPFVPGTRALDSGRAPAPAFTATFSPAFGSGGGPGAATGEPADPCADRRAAVDEANAHAARMAPVAEAAQVRLREARRAYDEHAARRDRAALTADPRAVRAAKDEAQAQFRRSRLAAQDRAAVEAAASAWLREINRVNARTREAAIVMRREAAVEAELLRAVEKAGLDADVARIGSEHAAEASRAALMALATCEEAERLGTAPPEPIARTPRQLAPEGDESASLPAAPGEDVAILRLLRGDRATMRSLVERLGGSDPDDQRRWQLMLSDLVDAIVAQAIDASALTFPEDHVFWGPYTQAQCREIASAMAALGYRFDGMGGFADGRTPSQRDLSLALGYAGEDPMRIRRWPSEAEMPALFRDVRVDAGRHLAEAAGGLTMGEMVDLLGRRAEPLAELWNAWGRVRPILLEVP